MKIRSINGRTRVPLDLDPDMVQSFAIDLAGLKGGFVLGQPMAYEKDVPLVSYVHAFANIRYSFLAMDLLHDARSSSFAIGIKENIPSFVNLFRALI